MTGITDCEITGEEITGLIIFFVNLFGIFVVYFGDSIGAIIF